ncbi:hypothetical protein MIMGU_mgv1a019700mg, partial [Erythranthe guttata]
MTGFNPLTTILNQNKLTGPNYVDWKLNLFIVHTAEDYLTALIDECPELPDETTPPTEELTRGVEAWKKADKMARCYILGSMSSVLQTQNESFATSYEIMENLNEMFGDQNRAARQVATKALMNTHMAEGTPVRDHVLKMMGLLGEMTTLGAVIDSESQVDI